MQDLTSDRIIDYLNNHPPCSTVELSSALLLTKADIRYHLKHLQKIGLVTRIIRNKQSGAGRPGYYYAKTIDSHLSGYRLIALVCTDILFNRNAELPSDEAIVEIVDRISGYIPENDLTGTQRLGAAVQNLISMGYQSTWEARPDHPILLLRNCPYLELALEQPGLCRMDHLLVEKLTGWKCDLTQRIRDDIHQIPACRFSLMTPV